MTSLLRRLLPRQQSDLYIAIAVRHGRVNFVAYKGGAAQRLLVNDELDVEQQQYARTIERLLQRYAKLGLKGARTQVVLGPRLVQQTVVDKPALNDDELVQALPWTIKDLVDIPAADMVADYYESPVQIAGREKITAVVVQKSWLQQLLEPLHAAKLNIQGVVNEDLACCSLLPPDHAPTMLVSQYGDQQAQLILVKQRGLVVSRQLKPIQSVLQQAEPEPFESDMLAIELQRSMDYFSGQLRQAPLQHIQLALPGQHLSLFRSQLEQSLSLAVDAFRYPAWAQELAAGDYSDVGALAGLTYILPDLVPPLATKSGANPSPQAPQHKGEAVHE